MTGFILLTASVGFMLGIPPLRIVVLAPVLLVVWFGAWIAAEGGVWPQLLSGVLASIALQVGYFFAMGARYVRNSLALASKSSALSPTPLG